MALPVGVTRFTAVPTGVFGNLDFVTLVFSEGAGGLTIVVDGAHVTLTVGTTGGTPNLAWDAIAALVNADPAASAVLSVEGSVQTYIPVGNGGPLQGGSAGLGEGQFFSAAAEPPPPPAAPVMTLTFKGQKVYGG